MYIYLWIYLHIYTCIPKGLISYIQCGNIPIRGPPSPPHPVLPMTPTPVCGGPGMGRGGVGWGGVGWGGVGWGQVNRVERKNESRVFPPALP